MKKAILMAKNQNKKILNSLIEEDCLVALKEVEDNSIDLILCDLPYGTTRNKWDSIVPLDDLWAEYKRILRIME